MYTEKQVAKWVKAFKQHEVPEAIITEMLTSAYSYVPNEQELESVISTLERVKKHKYHTSVFFGTRILIPELALISGSLSWINSSTLHLSREMNEEPMRFLAHVALSGNVEAYKLAETRFPKARPSGGEFVTVFDSVLLSGNMEMFHYALTLPNFASMLNREFFGGEPYAANLTRYGTPEMLAQVTRLQYMTHRLPKIFIRLQKESCEELVRLLIQDIHIPQHRKSGLNALKVLSSIHPEWEKKYTEQYHLIITNLNAVLNSQNWFEVSAEELSDLRDVGVSEANQLLKKRDALKIINNAQILIQQNSRVVTALNHSLSLLQSTMLDGDLSEALYLIGQLYARIEADDDDKTLSEQPFFFYFLSALYGNQNASASFDANTQNRQSFAYNILDAILKRKITTETEKMDFLNQLKGNQPEEVTSAIISLLSYPISRLFASHLVNVLSILSLSEFWNDYLQQHFNLTFANWLEQSGNEAEQIALISQYYINMPAPVFMPAITRIISLSLLDPAKHAMTVLLAATFPNPSQDLDKALQIALPIVKQGDQKVLKHAESVIQMQDLCLIANAELQQTVMAKISQQIQLLRKDAFFKDDKIISLLNLLIKLSGKTPCTNSFEQYLQSTAQELLLLQKLLNAASKLHFWIANPTDLHSDLQSEQYHLILRHVLLSLQKTSAPKPPAVEPSASPRSSYDALSPAVFTQKPSLRSEPQPPTESGDRSYDALDSKGFGTARK